MKRNSKSRPVAFFQTTLVILLRTGPLLCISLSPPTTQTHQTRPNLLRYTEFCYLCHLLSREAISGRKDHFVICSPSVLLGYQIYITSGCKTLTRYRIDESLPVAGSWRAVNAC